MTGQDVSDEQWREYLYGDRIYRIPDPQTLYVGTTTHRVLDADGVVHCVPAPGQFDCVLRWLPKDPGNPVAF